MVSMLVNRDVEALVSHARQQQARDIEVTPVTLKDIFLDAAVASEP
jgi:hypothetical protein